MDGINSSKSPYRGLWIALLILIIIPVLMSLLLFLAIDKWQYKQPFEVNFWTGVFFGFLIGSCFQTITIIVGLYKGSFKNMIMRVVHFIGNARTSFKLAWMIYKDEVAEQGLVFWVIFPVMSGIYGITIFSLIKVINLLY